MKALTQPTMAMAPSGTVRSHNQPSASHTMAQSHPAGGLGPESLAILLCFKSQHYPLAVACKGLEIEGPGPNGIDMH